MIDFLYYLINWDPNTYPFWHNVLFFISACLFGWLAAVALLQFVLFLAMSSVKGMLKEQGLDEEAEDWDPWK